MCCMNPLYSDRSVYTLVIAMHIVHSSSNWAWRPEGDFQYHKLCADLDRAGWELRTSYPVLQCQLHISTPQCGDTASIHYLCECVWSYCQYQLHLLCFSREFSGPWTTHMYCCHDSHIGTGTMCNALKGYYYIVIIHYRTTTIWQQPGDSLDSLASPSSGNWDWSTANHRVVLTLPKSVMTNNSAEAMSCDILHPRNSVGAMLC